MLNKCLLLILGLPKTIYFNLKYLPFNKAIKLPIFVSHRVVLKSMKGKVEIISPQMRTGIVKIGFGYVGIFDSSNSRSIWECNGIVVFCGSASIGHGSKICVGSKGKLKLGDNFTITAESQVVCFDNIIFGDDVLMSWQCLIMDTDFHKILKDNNIINSDKPIIIGDKVWIGCRATILKGISIADGCVIAANSNVVKSFLDTECIVGGNPAKIINRCVKWQA